MTNFVVQNYIAVNNDDITTPSATAKYPLGMEVDIKTTTNEIKRFKYVKSHGALTAYVPYAINGSHTSGSETITAAPATLASAVNLIGVPQVAFTSGYYGFVQIKGIATSAVDRAVTAGWTLEAFNAGVSLAGIATTVLVGTIGYVITTTTAATNTSVLLIGKRAEIRASS